MNSQPMLSILLPTFNRAGYMRECLLSLLATSVDCEVVIGDNASADNTEAVVRAFGDPRIRYFRHPENMGPVRNFNFLLAEARGKYICIFGDDDAAMPGCFEPKIALLESHPHIDLVYTLATGIDGDGRPLPLTGNLMGRIRNGYVGGRDEFQELLMTCYISWQTMVFRRTAYDEVGPLEDGGGIGASNDWFWLQGLVRGRQTAFIPDRTVKIRFHPGSLSLSEAKNKGLFGSDRLEIWRRWLIQDPNPPFVSEWMWERMATCVTLDVKDSFPNDAAKLEASQKVLQEMQRLYRRKQEEKLRAAISLGDPFQTGLEPWPLDGVRESSFYFEPKWDDDSWKPTLEAYLHAFSDADAVTLVLTLDPASGVAAEQVGAAIEALVAATGIGSPADMMLVTDAQAKQDIARLYTAVNVIVAVDDPVAAARARRMGRSVLSDLAPDSWKEALS
jgi:glycosyltransferase involved in cell wall biosynthesis